MNLSCSSKMIKYLMFAFNLFFVISGIIIIAVGATVKTVYSEYSDFLDSKYFTLPNMLIATGAFIFIISFFGCCGAIKESWIMLGVFSILLCIIFIFEFSAAIAGYVLKDKTISYLDETLQANLKTYSTKSNATWDAIQSGFHCCGVDYFTDWNVTFLNDDLPVSCCPTVSGTAGVFYCNGRSVTVSSEGTTNSITSTVATTTTTNATTNGTTSTEDPNNSTASTTSSTIAPPDPNPKSEGSARRKRVAEETPGPATTSNPYTIGCKSAFGQYIQKHAVQIGGCALGLALIQILGIAFSCHLVRQLKNGYYST